MAKKVKSAAKEFMPAYHRRKWVLVPILYYPVTEVKPVPGKPRPNEMLAEAVVIDPKKISDRELRGLCKSNDIPYYWVTGKSEARGKKKASKSCHKVTDREGVPLTPEEFMKFITCLRLIDKPCALIAEVLWRVNEALRIGGAFVTLEEVLRLKCHQVYQHKSMVDLMRTAHGRSELVAIELPKGLITKILKLVDQNSIFVFANRKGGPLTPEHVKRHFVLAGHEAKLRPRCKEFKVTPGLLRPIYDPMSKAAIAYRKRSSPTHIAITDNHLDELLQHMPEVKKNAGAKSKYGHKVLLKAIIYRMQRSCKWSELPSEFPPWKAVSSQYQRWKNHGFIKRVEKLLANLAIRFQV